MKWLWLIVSAVALNVSAQTAAELGARLREITLDPDACYRVRNLNFSREDARFYLTDGYLIFAKPVAGQTLAAVFSAENEGGDAEVLVLAPNRDERMSLASFIQSPNLNEHFRSALLLFTDSTGAELLKRIRAGEVEHAKDRGLLLADNWRSTLRNLASSFQVRLVRDMLSPDSARQGVFFAALAGNRLGNFDVIYDPASSEQITVGQVSYRQGRSYFDTWTGFEARSFRNGTRKPPEPPIALEDFRIDVTIQPDLRVSGVTRMRLKAKTSQRAAQFDISQRMAVSEVLVDGKKAEIFERESMRANLMRHDQNTTFLVVPSEGFEAGRSYEIAFRHSGEVIADAGNGVYFVGARGGWYPRINNEFTTFDLTFHYPASLNLVATGEVVEDRLESTQHVTRLKSGGPIRLAGFNLGQFDKVVAARGNFTVEIDANKRFERALERRREQPVIAQGSPISRRVPYILVPGAPDSSLIGKRRLEQVAAEIAEAFEFMAARMGPPPLTRLTGSPIPGSFGQGYPGLLFLSTLYYLEPEDRPPAVKHSSDMTLFLDLLGPHETAHQWWGNVVAPNSHRDEWLMEAFANYVALLFLEKRNGPKFLDAALDLYRRHLLEKAPDGRTVEASGPITWGARLESAATPEAWRIITYDKGSWILHMLRRRMGEQRFEQMLAELVRSHRAQTISTEALHRIAAGYLPPKSPDASLEAFFDTWVYGTGIPTLQMDCTIRGKAPSYRVMGSITQSGVDTDFSTPVPVEVQFSSGPSLVRWVQTAAGTVKFSIDVRQRPVRVVMDPGNSVLAVKK